MSMGSKDELCLSIGGVVGHLVLRRAPAALRARIRQQYAPFALPCSGRIQRAFSLTVTFHDGPRPVGDRRPVVRTTEAELDIRRSDFHAVVRTQATAGPWSGSGECQATAVAFESLLRILWSVFLSRQGGGLFQACAFRRGDQGFVAAGPRGPGKTSLRRQIPDPEDVLGDAAVVIHRGASGTWRVSGTPFDGGTGRAGASLESVALTALVFLDEQPRLEVTALPGSQAVLRALECLICYQSDPESIQRNVALVLALCRQRPTLLLASDPGTPFPAIVAALESAAGVSPRRPPQGPPNAREQISALRAKLARHGRYALRSRGGSMRPFIRPGDCLFIEQVREQDVCPGDVIVFWRPGARPSDDLLISHRMVARSSDGAASWVHAKGDANGHLESFTDGRQAQVIGRVQAVSSQGRARPVPSRLGGLALLGLSLMLGSLWKARLRL